VRTRESAVASIEDVPASGPGAGNATQTAIVLSTADDDRGVGVAGTAVELGNAEVVVQFLPAGGSCDRVYVGSTINAAIVTEENCFDRGAVERRIVDDDVLVRVSR